jgi:hypothetical protein
MPNRLNVWVCFGRPIHELYLGPIWRALYFSPGSIFGVVQRTENPRGTIAQQLSIWRARDDDAAIRGPDPLPGYHHLLQVTGDRSCTLVLALIDAIQDQDIDPPDVCPDYWRLLHWRLSTRRDPHLYTRAEHQLYLDHVVQKR